MRSPSPRRRFRCGRSACDARGSTGAPLDRDARAASLAGLQDRARRRQPTRRPRQPRRPASIPTTMVEAIWDAKVMPYLEEQGRRLARTSLALAAQARRGRRANTATAKRRATRPGPIAVKVDGKIVAADTAVARGHDRRRRRWRRQGRRARSRSARRCAAPRCATASTSSTSTTSPTRSTSPSSARRSTTYADKTRAVEACRARRWTGSTVTVARRLSRSTPARPAAAGHPGDARRSGR